MTSHTEKKRFFTESRGSKQWFRRSAKKLHAEGARKRDQLNREKGSRGKFPRAGSRDSVPCGGWGNAPTVPRPTSIANALNKGAGSEASLPVTLRVRRRVPKLLFPQDSVMNQKTQTAKRRVPLPARRFAACANYFCLSPDFSFCSAASAAACSACFFVRPVPWASSTPKRLTAASNVRLCGGPSCAIIS